jgi:hypothetical protein
VNLDHCMLRARPAIWLAVAWALTGPLGLRSTFAVEPFIIYETGFEVTEGYSGADELTPLRGQMGWVGEGSGGNGLLADFFEGYGQQAFIGYNPPAVKDDRLNLWRPVGYLPPLPNQPLVRFSVLMEIADSTNGEYDDFRWSVYNTANTRLFTLDFDNSRAEVFYLLDDGAGFKSTGFAFENGVLYELSIMMNLGRNTWTASINEQVVVESQPITTAGSRLDISDVDAVWLIRRPGFPGDNYMLFDEYRLRAEAEPSIPPVLELFGFQPDGQFKLRLHGERGLTYAVDVTSDFVTWSPLGTNTLSAGWLDILDPTAPDYPTGFYRARQVGP